MKLSVCILVCVALAAVQAVPQGGILRGRRVGGGGRPRVRGNVPAAALPPVKPTTTPKPQPPRPKGPSCAGQACADGFSMFQKKCYKVISSPTPIDFTTSQRRCQQDSAVLASDSSAEVHEFIKSLLKPALTENIDSRYRRAFVGLMCQNDCDTPSNWLYADSSRCQGNAFCDWSQTGNQWNAVPTGLVGASIAAILDDASDTQYRNKLQPYPVSHQLMFAVCQRTVDSTDHLKPRGLQVAERLANVELVWKRPQCTGEVENYIFVLLGGSTSYDTEIKCSKENCVYELNPADCNDCITANVEYTFSIAPVLANAQLGPAITVSKKIAEECVENKADCSKDELQTLPCGAPGYLELPVPWCQGCLNEGFSFQQNKIDKN
ncbi:C-type lectin-like [Trinorchestia longiramus]|nr:C-type lectin-like [Trinorchestia longiramus]